MKCLLFQCVLSMSPIILYLFFLFVVHSIPVIIVQPFKRCKIVLEFVPASYAINRLCKCLCGNSMLPINKLMFPDTRSKFLESSSHERWYQMCLHPGAALSVFRKDDLFLLSAQQIAFLREVLHQGISSMYLIMMHLLLTLNFVNSAKASRAQAPSLLLGR